MFGTKKAAEQNEDMRALLNAGWQRDRPVIRCFGPRHDVAEFNTFAMVALAAIKGLPYTITDRAVSIALHRRGPAEQISRFRMRRDAPPLRDRGERLGVWVAPQIEVLKEAEPEMPVEDRAADAWEPLFAIANAAGSDWPHKARLACTALEVAEDDSDTELGTLLLSDIRAIFAAYGPFISSADMVSKLRAREESPWETFEFSTRKLAYRLRESFGIVPGYNPARTVRGYRLDAFEDALRGIYALIRPIVRKMALTSINSTMATTRRDVRTPSKPSVRTLQDGPRTARSTTVKRLSR